MDDKFRQIERQYHVDNSPDNLKQLLHEAARCNRLGEFAEHIPFYLQHVVPETLEEAINDNVKLRKDHLFTPFAKAAMQFHLTHKGSGNFSEIGTAKFEISLRCIDILQQLGLINSCLVVAHPIMQTEIYRIAERLSPVFSCDTVSPARSSRKKDELLEKNYQAIIVNEGHFLRNRNSRQSQTLYELGDKAIYKMVLTGVPILNGITDAFGIMRFIHPETFGRSYSAFINHYEIKNNRATLEREKEISDKIYEHCFRFVRT